MNKVQKSRTDAVVDPTKYFRDVETLEQGSLLLILCDVDFFMLYLDRQAGRQIDRIDRADRQIWRIKDSYK